MILRPSKGFFNKKEEINRLYSELLKIFNTTPKYYSAPQWTIGHDKGAQERLPKAIISQSTTEPTVLTYTSPYYSNWSTKYFIK